MTVLDRLLDIDVGPPSGYRWTYVWGAHQKQREQKWNSCSLGGSQIGLDLLMKSLVGWEGGPRRRGYMHTYSWFTSSYAAANTTVRYVCSVAQSCPTLCGLMGYSPPGSSAHRIFQARILEWVAMPFSRGSSKPRDQTHVSYVSCIGRQILFY